MIWQVTGYDTEGRELFSQEIEAPDENVAKLYVGRDLRLSPNGTVLANSAVRIEAKPARVPEPPGETPGARRWRRDARQKRDDRR